MPQPPVPDLPVDFKEYGFSLRNVCWGYREIFARTLGELNQRGLIGESRQEVTAVLFDLLRQADRNCFDHVLKAFLDALHPGNAWLFDLPALFEDVVLTGRKLAEMRLAYGVRYFEILGTDGLGSSPEQIRELLEHLNRLTAIDGDLAMALLKQHRTLRSRLNSQQLNRYLDIALEIYRRRRENGIAFIEGRLATSETYIREITREILLDDVRTELTALTRALSGMQVEVMNLSQLDADDLIERGPLLILSAQASDPDQPAVAAFYLVDLMRSCERVALNHAWYRLAAVVAAGLLAEDSFSRIHGLPGHRTCADLVGHAPLAVNLFMVLEYARVLQRLRRRWPGLQNLLDFGLNLHFSPDRNPTPTAAERLLRDLLTPRSITASPLLQCVQDEMDQSVNCLDTASRITAPWFQDLLLPYPGLDRRYLPPIVFLPDFLFPLELSPAANQGILVEMKENAEKKTGAQREKQSATPPPAIPQSTSPDDSKEESSDADPEAKKIAHFLYDEWAQPQNDYFRHYCSLTEIQPPPAPPVAEPPGILEDARRLRRVFERLRPDLQQKKKHLSDGDQINPDALVDYLVRTRSEPEPRLDFYEKKYPARRDIAVLILLDVSGSTGETGEGGRSMLELEKHASLLLGHGLALLDDAFSVCGFCSNGREDCRYLIFKDFDAPWNASVRARILAAQPAHSTRMGPALRHAGVRLSARPNRRRLLILVSDGKPMDMQYEFETRYAQYDVRRACDENTRLGIHTFAIVTAENSVSDLELMFPRRRFLVLNDWRQLPAMLPRLYLSLTS